MSKIADLFRGALAERSPSAAEARADFEQILVRARRRRQLGWIALAAAAALGVAVAVAMTRGGRDPAPPGSLARAPEPASDQSVRIYVRRADEPEAEAFSLTLKVQGDL
jgi:hypothetical protein